MIRFSDIKSFRQHLKIKGRSPQTIKTYSYQVKRFLITTGLPLRQVSDHHIRMYCFKMLDSGFYKRNTVLTAMRSLRVFYRYLYRAGLILCDPTETLVDPKPSRWILRKILSPKTMDAIRESVRGGTLLKLRDRAIIEVLYSSGIRLSELFGLDIGDVDPYGGRLHIQHGKGGRERMAVLSCESIQAVSDYLEKRLDYPDKTPALWINFMGNRLSRQWIWRMLKQAAADAEIEGPSNPHAWRHGVATALLKRGASINDVQHFLGHTTVKATQIYTHLNVRDLQTIHSRTHPREQDYESTNTTIFSLNRSLNCT